MPSLSARPSLFSMQPLWMFVFGLLMGAVLAFAGLAQTTPVRSVKPGTGDTFPVNQANGLQMAHALRKRYGLHGSVVLTRAAQKILDSFVDEQQAALLWHNAQESISAAEREDSVLFGIDTHAMAGLVLSRNSHGMTPDRWQQVLLPLDAGRVPLDVLLQNRDELAVYLQLPAVWDRLLAAMRDRPHVDWQNVFGDLLSSPLPKPATLSIWQELVSWAQQPQRSQNLADVALTFNRQQHRLSLMQQALLKKLLQLTLNKDRQHYLAAALNWLEAFSIASTYLADWLAHEGQVLQPLLENNDTWFIAHHDKLAAIDERLPKVLEQSFQRLQKSGATTAVDFQKQMAAIFFSLPDIHAYLKQPFRRLLQQQLEVCLNLSETQKPLPDQPIEPQQYTGCVEDLAQWAAVTAREDELAGSLQPPEDDEALARVLQLPAWQIINTLYAMEARADCLQDSQRKANPLEWFLGSESLVWFNDRWPQYLESLKPVTHLTAPVSTGESLQAGYACLRDPVGQTLARRMAQVIAQWQRVKQLITAVADEYRREHLKPGSDIDLLGSLWQASHYRPQNLTIGPCDPRNTCGVHSELEPSRALLALFPNHLLLADQLNLGEIRLCYDNVGWENREAGPTHLSNPAVANYYGNLALSLKGYFNNKLVFARRIQSLQKYHYLFGRNDPAVLQLACPLPILGEQIVTQLPEGTHGLVPNRLTFLTAARANADAIIKQNWTEGEEWRDRLADDLRVKVLASNSLEEVKLQVEEKFIEHTSALQKQLYRLLLGTADANSDQQQALADAAAQYFLYRRLVQAMASVFIPDQLLFEQNLHAIFYGQQRLPDKAMLARFYRQQIAIRTVNERFERFQEVALQAWLQYSRKTRQDASNFRALDPVLLKLHAQKAKAEAGETDNSVGD